MILVRVQRNRTEISKITVSGHAESAPYGEDLICAAVSSIVTGTLNAIDEMAKGSCLISQNEEKTVIEVKKTDSKIPIILDVMLYQLKTLAESYSEYLEVEEETSYEI